jgi:hypothetical protein
MGNRKDDSALYRWTLGAGVFNIVAAFPLSLPFFYKHYYAIFNALNAGASLGGGTLLPPTDGNGLFINTMGLALVLVGMMMIYASKDLDHRKGIPLLNAIIRLVFPVYLIYYLAARQLPWILALFGVVDIAISMNLFYYLHKSRQAGTKRASLAEHAEDAELN